MEIFNNLNFNCLFITYSIISKKNSFDKKMGKETLDYAELSFAEQSYEKLRQLFQKVGQDPYIGEAVSQEEHMTQAALLAKNEGYDDSTIAGAL